MGRTPEKKGTPYTILAQDDGDEDGGTIYFLYDNDRVIAAASWPQPLERIAHITGHPVLRATYGSGGVDVDDD